MESSGVLPILRSQAASDAEREWAELELLFDIARTFDKHVELRTALGPLLSLLESRAGLTWGMVTLLDRATGLLKIEEAYGLSPEE
jgi:Nif-specific regulatory protein